LQTDYIDLYQLHGGTLEDPIDDIIEAFEELKETGLIREYGISSIRPAVIKHYARRSNIVSVMSQYSILDRRPETNTLPLLSEYGISLIARGPIAKGILSNKGIDKVPANGYLDYTKEELYDLINQLSSLLKEGQSLEHLALKFVLSHPVIATTIPGASKIEQLIKNINTINVEDLSNEELTFIRSMSKANIYG
jgi:aryl-alcohol dehydrogenase-like predicted oxidoreductase